MAVLDTIRDLQTRSLDQMTSVQDSVADYNERIASSVVGSLPEWQAPYAQYLPKPIEVVESYYSFVGELHEANKTFASRLVSVWERPDTDR